MQLAKAQIRNYKSIHNSDWFTLSPGFNVFLGTNNAGKTAVAEALSLNFGNKLHRSPKTAPSTDTVLRGKSEVFVSFSLEQNELLEYLLSTNNKFHLPCGDFSDGNAAVENFKRQTAGTNVINCKFEGDGNCVESEHKEYSQPPNNEQLGAVVSISRDANIELTFRHKQNIKYTSGFAFALTGKLTEQLYLFNAERLNVAEFEIGTNPILNVDASNLAQVLHLLQAENPSQYDRLNALIETVFPDVRQITVPPISKTRTKVLVWPVPVSTERKDLAVSLSESGTGIGQVLAILYVVLTAIRPKIIIIDEPQSFLHPGAVRKLFSILQSEFPQHQYLITTHSPLVLAVCRPRTVVVLRKQQNETVFSSLALSDVDNLRNVLAEVGARMSDVFGADNILWVEGRTEEQCFPQILEGVAGRSLFGTVIVGIVQTGDFKGKQVGTILEIYSQLSSSGALRPPTLGFLFDGEHESPPHGEELQRRLGDQLHFLGRRMYENYLLNAAAITAIANSIENFSEEKLKETAVREKLTEMLAARELSQVDGASILSELFLSLSETTVEYDKVRHGTLLTQWIIENDPDALEEVVALLVRILDQATKEAST